MEKLEKIKRNRERYGFSMIGRAMDFKNTNKTLRIFVLIMTFGNLVYSQVPSEGLIPPSPTASSLGKYGDIPVSLYTGIPNIDIPLLTVTEGNFKLPISLSYHSSGVKIEEEAGWVGLGWSLNAGGVITRTIRGTDDFMHGDRGYPNTALPSSINELTNTYLPNPTTESQDWEYFRRVENGMIDGEPDIFYFNFAGRTGKFCLGKRNGSEKLKVNLMSQEDVDIQVNYTDYLNPEWIVTTEDGVRYEFRTRELTKSYYGSSTASEQSAILDTYRGGDISVSTWYLDKIVTPSGGEINFKYNSQNDVNGGTKSIVSIGEERAELVSISSQGNGNCVNCSEFAKFRYYTGSMSLCYNVHLSQITFSNGQIDFATSDREDLEPQFPDQGTKSRGKKLDFIRVSGRESQGLTLLKEYQFLYTYFNGSSNSPYYDKRLQLTDVREGDGQQFLLPYKFSYYKPTRPINGKGIVSGDLPSKESKSRDHWGFFNGKNNNSIRYEKFNISTGTLVPPATLSFSDGSIRSFAGADRESDIEFAKVGALQRIEYPTGGRTEFDYELNQYFSEEREVITQEKRESVNNFGPKVTTGDPRRVEATVSFSRDTEVSVNVSVNCYEIMTGIPCFIPGSTYKAVFASIRSANTTGSPSFFRGFEFDLSYTKQSDYQTLTILIPAGTYKLEAYGLDGFSSNLSIRWKEGDEVKIVRQNKNGGGIRIARINDLAETGSNRSKIFKYHDVSDSTRSSGVLMAKPQYVSFSQVNVINYCASVVCAFATRSSYSNRPLGSGAQGNPVGYSYVTVFEDDNGIGGKLVYSYRNSPEYTRGPAYPNLPQTIPNDNGLLKSEQVYAYKGNKYQMVHETLYQYETVASKRNTVWGVKAYGRLLYEGWANYKPQTKYYEVLSEWWRLKERVTKEIDVNDQSKIVMTTETNLYESPYHFQTTSVTITKSDGSREVAYTSYPHDYSNTTGFIGDMKTKHLVAFPIEQVKYREVGSTRTVLSGGITTYGTGGKGQVDQVLALETAGPIALSSFRFSNRSTGVLPSTGSAAGYSPDTRYSPRLSYGSYDAKGNPLQVTRTGGTSTSYVWGYGGQHLVAEIRNAPLPTVTAALGGQAAVDNFRNLIAPTDAQVAAFLAPLRSASALKAAQVTTYTYKPLVGMTGMTDASGRTTRYEYDGLGRLRAVRDPQGNLTGEYQYHYRNQ